MSSVYVFKNHNRLELFAKYVTHCLAICQLKVAFVLKRDYFSINKPNRRDVFKVAPVILRLSQWRFVKGQAVEFDNMFVRRLMAQAIVQLGDIEMSRFKACVCACEHVCVCVSAGVCGGACVLMWNYYDWYWFGCQPNSSCSSLPAGIGREVWCYMTQCSSHYNCHSAKWSIFSKVEATIGYTTTRCKV